ncbi:hypothetical protein [Butyrivibrio proteoclasticus]|uniref:hypothetical protein n=1 Tax=Butyrivibrio proteoclasticus TaxID=43305 RepID=UPI0015A6E25F|nr:hypothetical protein [Butyrivibrio proteoclasticus]
MYFDTIAKYKKQHPDYKTEIKEASIEEQKQRYEAYLKEKNTPKKNNTGAQN